MAKVSFLGLGVMGFPMAGHLSAAGHEVTVYNRTQEKAEAWVKQHGGKAAKTPAAAAEGREFVFCCVGNDEDLRAVTTGADGAVSPCRIRVIVGSFFSVIDGLLMIGAGSTRRPASSTIVRSAEIALA